MNTIWTVNLFYPMLFLTIGIILVVLICSAKSVMINFKGQESENFRLSDTTTKMKDMHKEAIKVDFTSAHEKELHKLELMVQDLNQKFDLLLKRIINIENNH